MLEVVSPGKRKKEKRNFSRCVWLVEEVKSEIFLDETAMSVPSWMCFFFAFFWHAASRLIRLFFRLESENVTALRSAQRTFSLPFRPFKFARERPPKANERLFRLDSGSISRELWIRPLCKITLRFDDGSIGPGSVIDGATVKRNCFLIFLWAFALRAVPGFTNGNKSTF